MKWNKKFMNQNSKIFIAGHNGMVGSSIVRLLKKKKFNRILTISRNKLDLRDQNETYSYLKENRPDYVFVAAARVGGIVDNIINSSSFLIDNMQIQNNLILGSLKNNVKNLIFLGSSCVYPLNAKKPLSENSLFSGPLEKTNESYALAKLTGMKLCSEIQKKYKLNYKSLIPCNLYGPNDNFEKKTSHFFPALIRKAHLYKYKDKKIEIWGNGKPKRELMYVDDLADACIFFSNKKYKFEYLNIGTGIEYEINYYANKICKVLSVNSDFIYNKKMPNGVLSKVMNISKSINFGWKFKTSLENGIKLTYDWYQKNIF